MKNDQVFVTTINCMDGRVQIPINAYMAEKYDADHIDTITEAGPNKILSENQNELLVQSIKSRYEISTLKHHSKIVAIVGHFDCGGNSACENEQIIQIKNSCELVKSWNSNINVVGLWVDKNWTVQEVQL